MKLVDHFKHLLENSVNLDDNRIARLNGHVDAVSSFLRNHKVFGDLVQDVVPQGSYAHRTIIKPVGTKEYDADVLLVLKGHPDWTPAQYTQELYKAFQGSFRYFGKAHRRTRCVYINYAGDFHMDVVPYVAATSCITNNKKNPPIGEWEITDPEGFTAWLEAKTRITGGRLPAVIRLLKYVRDSKGTFSVKSVLLTILIGGCIESWKTTFVPGFYADVPTALVNITEDLDRYLQERPFLPPIYDPSGTGQDFSRRWDQDGYTNFRKQIHYYAEKIRAAYDEPDQARSVTLWQAIFGTGFQAPPAARAALAKSIASADSDAQFIKDFFPVRISGTVHLLGRVNPAGVLPAYDLPRRGDMVGKNRTIDFTLTDCSVLPPYDVWWKVKNTGTEARKVGQLRGRIELGGPTRTESTAYAGSHYVEVYIVKDGVCVARDRQAVIIPQVARV